MTPDARRVAADLGEAGYAVDLETFPTRASAEPWLASYAALSAVAALLISPAPLAAALLGFVAVVLHARESDGRPLLRRRSSESTTVVAKSRVAQPPTLVVIAALDRLPRRFGESTDRLLALALQTSMAAVAATGAAAWVAEAEAELPSAAGTASVVAAAAIVALVLVTHRPPEAGVAEDNPAIEVLVALAPLLRDDGVWLIGVAGNDAIQALVDAHPDEVAGAAWLNLVPPASGDVAAVSEEGPWRERRGDRWLMGTAEEAGAEVRPYRFSTHATPLLARRRRALTLLVPAGEEGVRIALATARAAGASR